MHESICREFAEFTATLNSNFNHELHDDFVSEFLSRLDAIGDDFPIDEWKSELVEEPTKLMAAFRGRLLAYANEELSKAAFFLGEHVDRGVRPESVFRHMFDRDLHMQNEEYLDRKHNPDFYEFAGLPGSDVPNENEDELEIGGVLANRAVLAGDIAPDFNWRTELTSWLAQARVDVSTEDFDDADLSAAESRIGLVDRIDLQIRSALAPQDSTPSPAVDDEWVGPFPPKDWCKKFKIGHSTFIRWRDKGTFRYEKISDRQLQDTSRRRRQVDSKKLVSTSQSPLLTITHHIARSA